MIGIILAAGIGSRLRPMTNTKPKCLVTTAGKPLLQYQIDAYEAAGIRRLVIVVGTKAMPYVTTANTLNPLRSPS